MSLQDDYYDLKNLLDSQEHKRMSHALDRIWFAFCDLETQDMVRKGEITNEQYDEWKIKQLERMRSI